ncbi:DUF5133 domain-containing protein [Streptomyces sp. CA-135486]|uniref:DUF5133 domain-containing protein n=1 Tax=Streptomyces sp. CA-135486 TaxID=3240049 RepID=UPI003D9410BA
MLTAHPALLRNLVEQYRTLHDRHAEQSSPEIRRQLEDVTYTLCVSTGTCTAEEALTVAEQQLAAALTNPPATLRPAPGDEELTA